MGVEEGLHHDGENEGTEHFNVAEAYEYAKHALSPDSKESAERQKQLLIILIRAINADLNGLGSSEVEEIPNLDDAYKAYLEAKASGDLEIIKKSASILIEVASIEAEQAS